MKVFISWSGTQSKRLGEVLKDWLPGVLQLVRPYFTPSDIEKGTRWANEIAKELSESQVGILCITRDNLHSDWVLFEAGALSKSLDKAHVCPILFGITNTDLAGPLKQFQTTEFTKEEIQKLITVINSRLGENKLPAKTLDTVFEKWWPELESKIAAILAAEDKNEEPIRSERDMLEEILELSRVSARRSARPAGISPSAVTDLIQGFIDAHDEQAKEIGSYQDALNTLKRMEKAIDHVASRYRGVSPDLDILIGLLDELHFKVIGKEDKSSDDEIPF